MGKRLKLVRLVADLSLLLFQHGAEFERTLCDTDNWKQLSCTPYNLGGNRVPTAS